MKKAGESRPDGRGVRVAVVCSEFNETIVSGLFDGACEALSRLGVKPADIRRVDVPGAFELPLATQAAARSGRYDAVVALGAVIRGDTDHYEHICREAASGLAAVALATGVPVAFGVLTTHDEAQALQRSTPGKDNKGAEAARAAVAMVRVLRDLTPKARAPRKGTGRRRGA